MYLWMFYGCLAMGVMGNFGYFPLKPACGLIWVLLNLCTALALVVLNKKEDVHIVNDNPKEAISP